MGFLQVFGCACDEGPEKKTAEVAKPSSTIIIVQPISTGTAAVEPTVIPPPTVTSPPTPSPVVTSQPVADTATPPASTPAQGTTPTPAITPIATVSPSPSPITASAGTPTATPLPTRLPTLGGGDCQRDRDDIRTALDAYHEANGDWPTVDGQPGGDIVWAKLVPDLLEGVPVLDEFCEWQVDSDPEGAVCLLTPC